MVYLVMPVGAIHGWGICGKYIAWELSQIDQVRLVAERLLPQDVPDEMEFRSLTKLLAPPTDPAGQGRPARLGSPLLMAVCDHSLLPARAGLRGSVTVGYTFFEMHLTLNAATNASTHFDLTAAGSTWCEERMREAGVRNTATVIQGVDPRRFFRTTWPRRHFKDDFVIFSGGKFELRKGQDLVIRAVKALQEKHKDVVLVNSWYNPWPESVKTMQSSTYIRCPLGQGTYQVVMSGILAENGIDLSRTLTLAPRDNSMMRQIYENTDVGLFPNRCEGGTNLVLMEYMACGKPVVAAYNTGQRDVLTEQNSLRIMEHRPLPIMEGGREVAQWYDPSLDEIVAKLEWAYLNRDKLKGLGEQAAQDMAGRSWGHTARHFHSLLTGSPQP